MLFLCDSCLDGNYHQCECCEKYYSESGLERTYDDNWVCDSCREYHYYYCNDCGRATHHDDCHYVECREADYCPNCYDNHTCEDYIYSYHDFDCFSKRKTADEPLTNEYFGFELEVSGNRDYAEEFLDQVSDVVLMSDSSIEGGGFEIVTQPMTRKYFKERFKPQFESGLKFLDRNGFYGHGMGGMHVHVSADILSKKQIAQMAEILYGNEDDRNIWLCISQRKEENMEEWSCMTDRCKSFDEIANYEYSLPYIACPKDFFDDDDVELYPGKIITYDPQLYTSSSIQPMTFQSNIFINDISFLSDLMSEISGIFPNMMGAEETGNRTATEINVKTQGQTTRLAMVLDVINQYFIIPTVKNIAKLCANFKFGNEQIFLNKDNNPENVVITDEVRQAEYRYTYSDRNSMTERFSFADMVILAVERFANHIPLNVQSIFVWYMEQKGVENPERFLLPMEQMPLEVQQVLMQNPAVQEMVNRVQAEKAKQKVENPSPIEIPRETPESQMQIYE